MKFSESQILAVPSADAVTILSPTGEKQAERTSSACPRKVKMQSPEALHQHFAVWSLEAVTNRGGLEW